MDILESRLAALGAEKILDVATGRGGFAQFLLKALPFCRELVGIDFSRDNIIKAIASIKDARAKFLLMDAAAMGFPDNHFDLAVIANSLHHLQHPATVFREMKRVIKPGGDLFIFEMYSDFQSLRQTLHVEMHHWWAEIDRADGIVHNRTFLRDEIESLARKLGLADYSIFDYRPPEQKMSLGPGKSDDFNKIIDQYIARIKDGPDKSRLISAGENFRRRLAADGFYPATSLCILGRK